MLYKYSEVCQLYRNAVKVWQRFYYMFTWLVCVRCMRQHTTIRKQCQCPTVQCSLQCNCGRNNSGKSSEGQIDTSGFACCKEVRTGFDRRFVSCLSGLFALDVCASIHLYASNASAPLYSVFFNAIRVIGFSDGTSSCPPF